MLLCKCGRAFATPADMTDHLTVVTVFAISNHGVIYQDSYNNSTHLTNEGINAIMHSNFMFLTNNLSIGTPIPKPKECKQLPLPFMKGR